MKTQIEGNTAVVTIEATDGYPGTIGGIEYVFAANGRLVAIRATEASGVTPATYAPKAWPYKKPGLVAARAAAYDAIMMDAFRRAGARLAAREAGR